MQEKQLYFPKNTFPSEDDLIVQSNQITLGKYNFEVVEKRIFYIMIDKIRKRHVENIADNSINEDLWGNMIINFSASELGDIDNLTRVYQTLANFQSKSIQLNTEDNWISVGLINYAKHKKKENVYEIEVSKELIPYLVELSGKFTAYSLSVAISFRSKYTQRFYELCQMWRSKGYFFYTIDVLQNIMLFNIDYDKKGKEYIKPRPYAEFKRDVIEVARKELYESFNNGTVPASDIYFTYSVKSKTGARNNRVHELEFFVYNRDNRIASNWDLPDFKYNIRMILLPYFRNDPSFVTRITGGINSIELANMIYEKVSDKIQFYTENKDMNEISKILRTILKEDFFLS
jgi:plasmid replication initiation protein